MVLSDEFHEAVEAIRESGVINMLDKKGLEYYLDDFGYPNVAAEISNMTSSEYMDMLNDHGDWIRQRGIG